ncbi:11702_t:CDS:2 [Entrophospora sp. SA101]|nr:11702_t:CDS:2 [Entrophospora sp. SA101]
MKETIKPITDEYIDKEVFENESHIDTNILNELDVNEPGLEIEDKIYKKLNGN